MNCASSSSSSHKSLQLLEKASRFLPKTDDMLLKGLAGREPEIGIGLERVKLIGSRSLRSVTSVDWKDKPKPESTKDTAEACSGFTA